MTDRVRDWMAVLDGCYPPGDAESWDNVGLQVGDPDDEVTAVLVCLDVTTSTIAEARNRGAGLLLAHHPLFFRPLSGLTPSSATGRLALEAVRAEVAVAAAHTNFDVADTGTTAPIMRALGVEQVRPLAPVGADYVKVVVFVPVDDTAGVLAAAFAAGAGSIGEYDECSFRVGGTGTFRPSAGANPALGEREQRNAVAEDRIEVVLPRSRVNPVVDAITQAHPYEEVALDVYPLLRIAGETSTKGIGRVGDLPAPLAVGEIARRLRDGLPSPHLRVAGDPARMVTRVAACGGAGDGYIDAALRAGAQLYITGDLRHHVTLDALTMGLSLIDAGHYATEAAALPALIATLERPARERGLQARLLASSSSTEPWAVNVFEEE